MTDACCELGAKLLDRNQVLYETENFFVAPSIGQIDRPGYLLILTKSCLRGIGSISEDWYSELEDLQKRVRAKVKEKYGVSPMIFEHGPRIGEYRGGGCLDHAHLHVVPGVDLLSDIGADLMSRLENPGLFHRVDRVDSYKRAKEILHKEQSSYFVAESPDERRMIVEVNFKIPSQHLRRLIGKQRKTEKWDWALFPQHELVQQTIDDLQGKF